MENLDQQDTPKSDKKNLDRRAKLKLLIESYLASNTLETIAKNEINEKTKEEYGRKVKLIKTAKQTPLEYCASRNLGKRTYQTLRAALKHDTVAVLKDALLNPHSTIVAMELAAQRAKAVIGVDTYDYEPVQDSTKERRARESGKISKKRTLKGLPDDWRDQVFNHLQKTGSKHAPFALILHHTGCRPSELVNGVRVLRNGSEINITVRGSKCSDIHRAGQHHRTISYPADSDPGKALAQLLSDRQGQGVFNLPSKPSSFQKIYKAAAIKALGKKGKLISPYSARHQFSADLKISGMSQEDVARAMGHQAAHSQSQYSGARRKGKGYHGMTVTATTTVRHRPDRPIPEPEPKEPGTTPAP